jgi:hypothetical protein
MSYSDKRAGMVGWDPHESYQATWSYTQNVVAGGFEYGPDRDVTGLPAAPADGVRLRVGNPNQNQIAIAASSFGYRDTDKVITVWSSTLREDPDDALTGRIYPLENDTLVVGGVRYVLKSVKEAEFDTQYVCYCWRSPNQSPIPS